MDQTDEARAKRARPAKWARVQSPHKVKKTVVKQIDPERFEPSGPISQGDPQALISKTRLIPTVPLWHGVTTFWPKETRRAQPTCAKACLLAEVEMSSSKRDRLRREIFDTLPVEWIVAAAGLMRWQLPNPPSDVDLARFVASLNVRELHELRRLAQQAEGGTVH